MLKMTSTTRAGSAHAPQQRGGGEAAAPRSSGPPPALHRTALTVFEAAAALDDVATIRGRVRVGAVPRSSTTIVIPAAASTHLAPLHPQQAHHHQQPQPHQPQQQQKQHSAWLSASSSSPQRKTSASLRKTSRASQHHHNNHHHHGLGHGDFNYDLCCACGGGGELVCCERCPNAFHFSCTVPPLDPDNLPDGDWFCRPCAAKLAATALPPASTPLAFAAVVAAVSALNPIEYSVPPDLADLAAASSGRLDAFAPPSAAAAAKGADGDLSAKDRDVCLVCDLPFECDNSIAPAHRFDVPSLASASSAAAAAAAASASTSPPPSASGLAFLGVVDPFRTSDVAPRRNYGDKRKCAWCDDCYHVYCVRPASDPRLPPPQQWLCPRHFRDPDANYARQKLSKKVHALQQDPKWHRDFQAQRETQARASAAPLLFSSIKPTASLRSAAPPLPDSQLGDNVRRTFVTARELALDADIASRSVTQLRATESRLRADVDAAASAAFPAALATDVPDTYRPLLGGAGAADDVSLPADVAVANATATAAVAVTTAAAAALTGARPSQRKRPLDDRHALNGDDGGGGADDERSRAAVASLLALCNADQAGDNNDDDDDDDAIERVAVAEGDRRAMSRILAAEHVAPDDTEALTPTFVQFLAWQQLQLLHSKHKDALYDLRRKEMKLSTVTNESTHAPPRSLSTSRRSVPYNHHHNHTTTPAVAAASAAGSSRSSERKRTRGGLPRTACDLCHLKHFECRVPKDSVACARCISSGNHCSLIDNMQPPPPPPTSQPPSDAAIAQQFLSTVSPLNSGTAPLHPPFADRDDGSGTAAAAISVQDSGDDHNDSVSASQPIAVDAPEQRTLSPLPPPIHVSPPPPHSAPLH